MSHIDFLLVLTVTSPPPCHPYFVAVFLLFFIPFLHLVCLLSSSNSRNLSCSTPLPPQWGGRWKRKCSKRAQICMKICHYLNSWRAIPPKLPLLPPPPFLLLTTNPLFLKSPLDSWLLTINLWTPLRWLTLCCLTNKLIIQTLLHLFLF